VNYDYESFPKVVLSGSEATIKMRGVRYDKKFKPGTVYKVKVFSKVDHRDEEEYELAADDSGFIEVSRTWGVRGEYLIDIFDPEKPDPRGRPITTEHIFAVGPELLRFKPYRGDMHIHTHYSDGKASPIYMAVRGKKLGLDFIAITDHDRYSPSIEAMEEAKGIGLDMLLLPGEEASAEEQGGHILSLCASGPVMESKGDRGKYESEIAGIIENDLREAVMVDGLDKETYAHTKWIVNRIHELGGYAFLAHPYWVSGRKFNLNRPVYDQLLKDGEIDGIELLGDVSSEDNFLSIVKYYDEVIRGKKIPILGNSDTHHPQLSTYGRYWTIAFAEDLDKDSIFDAIFNFRAVACERHPCGELRIIGPFELVEYSFFLEREFFPLHDRICTLQGDLYMRVLEGAAVPDEILDALKAELKKLYWKSWGELLPGDDEDTFYA